jgi:hypothetical protein
MAVTGAAAPFALLTLCVVVVATAAAAAAAAQMSAAAVCLSSQGSPVATFNGAATRPHPAWASTGTSTCRSKLSQRCVRLTRQLVRTQLTTSNTSTSTTPADSREHNVHVAGVAHVQHARVVRNTCHSVARTSPVLASHAPGAKTSYRYSYMVQARAMDTP